MIGESDLLTGIARLERENRIIKSAVIAAVLLTVALFFVARFENGRHLVVKQLVVTDDAGNIVAQLGTSNRRTCLQLQGSADSTNAELCADKTYGAFLHLNSQNPAGRAYLSAGERVPEGGYMVPGLIIRGQAGKGMLSFHAGAEEGAESELVFGRGVEDNSIMLSGGSEQPTLTVWGARGKALWATPGNVKSR